MRIPYMEETSPLLAIAQARDPHPRAMHCLSRGVQFGLVVLFLVSVVTWSGLPHKSPKQVQEGYDVIIIGGGPAGSVLGRKIFDARDDIKILLVEAGGASQWDLGGRDRLSPESPLTAFDVPYYWPQVAQTVEHHWHVSGVLAARMLGGCGIHNAMLYVRALSSDIESWDMPGWNWTMALRHYIANENFSIAGTTRPWFHGDQGLIQTSAPAYLDTIGELFLQAAKECGIPIVSDFNDPAPGSRYGAGRYHFNIRNGIRDSAARAFLSPILNNNDSGHRRFSLELNTIVERIEIDQETRHVMGVWTSSRLDPSSKLRFIPLRRSLSKEPKQKNPKTKTPHGHIVLTAGALNTPKLLLRSGIGSQVDLSQKFHKTQNISFRQHLPGVGVNLQDHPAIAVLFTTTSEEHPLDHEYDNDMFHFKQYLAQAGQPRGKEETTNSKTQTKNIYASSGLSTGAFLIPPTSTRPEIQITVFPQLSEPHVLLVNHSKPNTSTILITIALMSPHGRNKIILDPSGQDIEIVPGVPEQHTVEHLDEGDVRKLAWGLAMVRDLMLTTAAMAPTILSELSPGSSAYATTTELLPWIRQNVFRNSHWVGTASMASRDHEGVVDQDLNVYGIAGLKVADASVIPRITNGNVHSTVVMVASRAAEILLQEL